VKAERHPAGQFGDRHRASLDILCVEHDEIAAILGAAIEADAGRFEDYKIKG
jgi:hypothetical protein